jgi:LysM repeat protein
MPDPTDPPVIADPAAPATASDPAAGPAPDPPVSPDPGTGTPPDPSTPPNPPEPGSEPTAAEKRIAKLVAERNRERERAAFLEGQLAATKQAPATPAQPAVDAPPTPPDPSEHEGGEFGTTFRQAELAYAADLGAWKVRQQLKADQEQATKATQEKTEQEKETALKAKLEEAEEEDPGVSDILKDPKLPLSRPMYDAIRESDLAPKLFRYLSDNRKEAEKIFFMTPAAAIRAVALIEAKLTAPPTAPAVKPTVVSQAPAPMTTVKGATGSPPVDEEHESAEAFYARRQREEFGPGGPRHHELLFRGRRV